MARPSIQTTADNFQQLLRYSGEHAPGTPNDFSAFEAAMIDDADIAAFIARVTDPDSLTNLGLWTGTPNALELLAGTGGSSSI
jgi:hypothetical protein